MSGGFDEIRVAFSRERVESLPVWVHLAGVFSDVAAGTLVLCRAGGLGGPHEEVLRPPTAPFRPVPAPKP
jgi:hypothetical protein